MENQPGRLSECPTQLWQGSLENRGTGDLYLFVFLFTLMYMLWLQVLHSGSIGLLCSDSSSIRYSSAYTRLSSQVKHFIVLASLTPKTKHNPKDISKIKSIVLMHAVVNYWEISSWQFRNSGNLHLNYSMSYFTEFHIHSVMQKNSY